MQGNITKSPQKKHREVSVLRFIVAVLFAFLLLYQPPMPVSTIYILTLISFGYLILNFRLNYGEYLWLIISFIAMFALLILVVLFNQTELSSISHFFWLFICIIPAAIAFSAYVNKSEKSFDYLFHVILVAACIQAILAYMCLFSEDVKEAFFKQMIKTGLYTKTHIEKWGHRIYGYGISLMYALPVIQAVIAAWSFLYGIGKNKNIYSILGVLILISAVVSAKIAFVVFVTVVLLGLLIGLRQYGKKILRVAVVILISILILMHAYSYAEKNNNQLAQWLQLLFEEESVSKYYTGYLFDPRKWELPDNIGVLFGTGEPRQNYDVDMGIVNDIWIGGLIYFGFTVGVVLALARRIKKNPLFPALWQRIMAVSLVVVFFIADMKGTAFDYSPFMALFVLVALFSSRNGHGHVQKE